MPWWGDRGWGRDTSWSKYKLRNLSQYPVPWRSVRCTTPTIESRCPFIDNMLQWPIWPQSDWWSYKVCITSTAVVMCCQVAPDFGDPVNGWSPKCPVNSPAHPCKLKVVGSFREPINFIFGLSPFLLLSTFPGVIVLSCESCPLILCPKSKLMVANWSDAGACVPGHASNCANKMCPGTSPISCN